MRHLGLRQKHNIHAAGLFATNTQTTFFERQKPRPQFSSPSCPFHFPPQITFHPPASLAFGRYRSPPFPLLPLVLRAVLAPGKACHSGCRCYELPSVGSADRVSWRSSRALPVQAKRALPLLRNQETHERNDSLHAHDASYRRSRYHRLEEVPTQDSASRMGAHLLARMSSSQRHARMHHPSKGCELLEYARPHQSLLQPRS